MLDILDALLAPFSRFLVARGVLFPELSERLKAHYVGAGEAMSEGKPTDSRLSVMTGLQRRDVARLRGFRPKEAKPNHLVRLVALWQSDPRFAGPAVLEKSGEGASFEVLAREVRRDVHPRTMLDTLIQTGTVAFDESTQEVTLIKSSYQPESGSTEQVTYLADNLGDHFNAATENVLRDPAPHFERAVSYRGLRNEDVATLEAEYRSGQMALFEGLSAKAAAMKEASGGAGVARFRAGGYFYQTEGDVDGDSK
jgi:hypothetical protein